MRLYGDILTANRGVIVHQVNLSGSMGAGIARSIRDKWPEVEAKYMAWISSGKARIGDVLFVQVGDELYVANLAGQFGYGRGRQTVYEAYDYALPTIRDFATQRSLPILIPDLIGAGLAGGDACIIHSKIDKVIASPHYVVYENRRLGQSSGA
jgi:O-acetyl-ADP-ribose deacetylase (regulator of RNase III)